MTTVCRLRKDAAETLIQIRRIFLFVFVRCVAPIVHTSALILLRSHRPPERMFVLVSVYGVG